MSEGTNADPCPETHKSFRFSVKKDKAKKKKLNIILSSVVKELGPGNKDWFENTTAQKIQQKKQRLENVDVSLCTPKDKIHVNQLNASTSTSSESSENKFYFKIQRLLTSQTSTPSQTLPWQVPVLGGSPDVVSGSAPMCKQMDIRKSLGISMNDSALSWTSSMATPTLMDSTFKGSPSPVIKQQKGLPRVLFSPGPSQTDDELHALENTSEDNTDDDELPFIPPSRRDSKSPGTLISPVKAVFRNIDQRELFNTDSELSENLPYSEEKLDTRSLSSPNICKIPFTGNASVATNVEEEASMPLFSQDLYIDDEIEEEQDVKRGSQGSPLGKCISKSTEDDSEKCVSEALSDFFDPPSSAVGRRRCAPRKGKKRKLLEDSLSLEVDNDNVMSNTTQRRKKMKTDLLRSEDKKDDQSKTDLQKEGYKSMEEYKISVKSEEIEEEIHSTNLNIHQRKQSLSLSQEDVSWENCSTPNNAKKTFKSILSSKKAEGSAVKSNKKVRFSVEEKSSLKRNLTQMEDEEYVSPDVFVQTLLTGDVNSEEVGNDSHTLTLANSERDSAQNNLMSENIHTDKSTKNYPDLEVCDELFSQVSPTALNEMCSVATLVDKSNTTQRSNLDTDKNKLNTKSLADDKHVSVKTEDKNHVSLTFMKTEYDDKATCHVCKKEDSLPENEQSNPRPTSLRGSIGLKAKTRKFLYPSTNQISKSCPKSVYGFAEQSEKNMRLTMNTNNAASKDPPQDTVLVQQSSTKLGFGEKNIDKNQQGRSTLSRGIQRNLGFESFSSLANNGKVDMETDRSKVKWDGNRSQPKSLHGDPAKLVQTGNMSAKPKKELRGNDDFDFHIKSEVDDVQSSKLNTPLRLYGQQSEGLVEGVPLKTEPCNLDYSSSECSLQSSKPVNVKTKSKCS
ncbi:uncharacterized protein LOC117334595 [Pecten maximus]|uniref:uncharacterized protein LOC117334595 n=1 Tax=Pecten maximus TaxID=6579 RepID=UPI001458570F|nr:uncharacterized protein LOC117334595 [Pecten maximus]